MSATHQDQIISVIGSRLYQPIADLIERLVAHPYQAPDRVSSNYFEAGYSSAIILLLAATVESLVQRDRYFYRRKVPGSNPSSTVSEHMRIILRYRRHAQLDELFEVRNSVAHNHLWEIDFANPAAGGRRHQRSSLVPMLGVEDYRRKATPRR